jgi:hypothetical protein
MKKFVSLIALSMILSTAGCGPNSNQVVQQRQACTAGLPHPWCMQLAQTKPLGSWDSNGPTNPEMRDDTTPYPTNPAVLLLSPGFRPIMLGGMP